MNPSSFSILAPSEDSSSQSPLLGLMVKQHNKKPPIEPKTKWAQISVVNAFTFCCAVQLTIYVSTLWPFLLQLDPSTSESFFGALNTTYSLGQALMSFVFGYFINKLERSKLAIILGFASMILGNGLHLLASVQLFSSQWVIFASRMCNGLGSGVLTVLRSFVVQNSSSSDRSRAISFNMASFALGLVVGHFSQTLFSMLGYPGVSIIGNLSLNSYTAPAFASISCNVISLLIVIKLLRDSPAPGKEDDEAAPATLRPYDKLAVGLCIFTQFVYMILISSAETIHPPFSMTMFNWSKQEALLYGSIRLTSSGFVALAIYCLDLAFNIWNRVGNRKGAIIGIGCLLVFHILTFSWWFLPGHLTIQGDYIFVNGTRELNPEPIGCRTSFNWCNDVTSVNVYLFNISYVILVGLGIAFINANLNTVYSKVIGPRKQGTLVGLLISVGCLSKTLGPVFLANLFERFGPRPVWTTVIFFSTGCMVLWILFYRRLQPLKMPK